MDIVLHPSVGTRLGHCSTSLLGTRLGHCSTSLLGTRLGCCLVLRPDLISQLWRKFFHSCEIKLKAAFFFLLDTVLLLVISVPPIPLTLKMETTNLTQGDLGSRVVLQVTVSSGGSTVPSVELDIFIPSSDSGSGGFFYIYPSSIVEVGGDESCW